MLIFPLNFLLYWLDCYFLLATGLHLRQREREERDGESPIVKFGKVSRGRGEGKKNDTLQVAQEMRKKEREMKSFKCKEIAADRGKRKKTIELQCECEDYIS